MVILTGYSAALLSVLVSPVTGATSILSVPCSPKTGVVGPGISTVVVSPGAIVVDLGLLRRRPSLGVARVEERGRHDDVRLVEVAAVLDRSRAT